jgi:hypothetical protein
MAERPEDIISEADTGREEKPDVDILGALKLFETAQTSNRYSEFEDEVSPDEQRYAQSLEEIEQADDLVTAPASLGAAFERGTKAGVSGLESDMNYFGALLNTLTGDEDGADTRIRRARQAETHSANVMEGMQGFGDFLEEPTFGGFLEQAVTATGQIAPMGVAAIGTSIAGALTASAGKLAVNAATRNTTRKLIEEIVDKAKREGVDSLTPDERDIIDTGYGLMRGNFRRAATGGAVTGAIAQEYPMMAGGSFAEFDEAGVELDSDRALQSLITGIPLAAIGVGGEAFIVKGLAKIATSKAAKTSDSLLAQYAKDIVGAGVRGGVTEAATEVAQEGALIAQRKSVDDTYTDEEAQLRLAQAAFAGFFGGKALSGGGASVAGIFKTARTMLEDKNYARTSANIDAETTGVSDDNLGGNPTREPVSDFAAQVDNVLNDGSTKTGVWLPENSGRGVAGVTQDNSVTEVQVGDETMYAARVPGRGTVLAKTAAVAQAVVDAQGSEGALKELLGFSDTVPEGADRVVRVINANGNVVSEQATDAGGEDAARIAAEGVAAEGQTIDVVSTAQALKDRKARYDEEQTREMQFDEDEDFTEEDAARSAGLTIREEDDAGLPVEEQVTDFAIPRTETRDPDFNERFQQLLDAVPVERIQEFQDLKDSMSDSALNFILEAVENDPEFEYFFTEVDGRLAVARIQTGLGMESGNARDAVQFVIKASKKLDKRKPRFLNIRMPNGATIPTTLPILAKAGKRLNFRSREGLVGDGMTEVQANRQGLIRIMKELAHCKSARRPPAYSYSSRPARSGLNVSPSYGCGGS